MRKIIKILVVLAILTGVAVSGGVYYASTKINPEEIKKIAKETLEKALPNTIVKIKTLEYSLGTSINFKLTDFDIKLKKGLSREKYSKKFFNVSEVNVSIPIMSILTNGGTISVNVLKPSITYNILKKTDTMALAQGTKKQTLAKVTKPTKDTAKEGDSSAKEVSVPSFVENSLLNVKFINTTVNYLIKGATKAQDIKGTTTISKVLLKKISLKEVSAFEIVSSIKTKIGSDDFAANLRVIGDFNLSQLLKKGDLKVNVVTTIKDISFSAIPLRIPNVKTNIIATLKKDGSISSKIGINLENVFSMKTEVEMNKNIINIPSLTMSASLFNAVELLDDETKKGLKDISFNNSSFEISGKLTLDSKKMKLKNNLKMKLTKPIILKAIEGINTSVDFKGSFINDKVSMSITKNVNQGEIKTLITTSINLMAGNFDIPKLKPINISVVGGNINISKPFLQKFLYGKKKGVKAKAKTVTNEAATTPTAPVTKVVLPKTNIKIDLRQIYIDKSEIKMSGNIKARNNKVNSKDLKFSIEKGVAKVTFDTTLINSAHLENKFTFNMKNLDFTSFNAFLPSMLAGVEGNFNGNASGDVIMNGPKLTYKVKTNIKAGDGQIKGLDIQGKVDAAMSKIKVKGLIIPDNFETLAFKGVLTQRFIKITNAEFRGPKRSVNITKIRGSIGMTDKLSSKIDMNFAPKNPASIKKLKKDLGLKHIPLTLKGKGFGITPDMKSLTKTLGKVVKHKAKKKVKKAVKKKLKKLLKNKKHKKKLDKLFKKFKF
jgi:hypothetical protein